MDKLNMSLDDMISAPTGKTGKGKGRGSGGAVRQGRGAGRTARAAAAPYQKPVRAGKGKGGVAAVTLAEMAAAANPPAAPAVMAPAKPAFVLTTGTTLRVGNLDGGVSVEDIEELFGELGQLKSATLAQKPDGTSKGFATVTYKRKADAETAMEKYNGVPLDGKPLRITLSQNVAPAASAAPVASNVQVTAGRGSSRVVTIAGVGKGGRGKGRGRGRGAMVAAEEEEEEEEEEVATFGGRGSGRGKGGGKGGKGGSKGKGSGKGGKGKGGGKGKPKTVEDLDAELDSYRASAAE